MTELNLQAERERLQVMRDNPQDDLERAYKRDALDGCSEPREWSDETVRAANTFWRIYEMGFNGRAPSTNTAPTDIESTRPAFEQAMRAKSYRTERHQDGQYVGMTSYRWEGWAVAFDSKKGGA